MAMHQYGGSLLHGIVWPAIRWKSDLPAAGAADAGEQQCNVCPILFPKSMLIGITVPRLLLPWKVPIIFGFEPEP